LRFKLINNTNDFDAIVVGSGISGGWAAKELCEKGLKVLLLDRGEEFVHQESYVNEHKMPWEYQFSGKFNRDEISQHYNKQKLVYAFDEMTKSHFLKDSGNPYQSTSSPYLWARSNIIGGRSLLWGRQSYRFSPQDFKANQQDKVAEPWPITYDEIVPWYDYVESFAGISGQAEGLEELPDSNFLPPMPLFPLEKLMKSRLKNSMPNVSLIHGRCAVLTENHNDRLACHYCGPCPRGCSTGSYFSSLSSTLPAAMKTKNLTIRANSLVEKLEYDEKSKQVSAVHVIDTKDNSRIKFSSKIVFLCASTIATTQILLNSKSSQFNYGLGNSSGVLGKYLMDHHSTSSVGIFFDYLDKYYQGHRPTGSYIPRFTNLEHKKDSEEDTFTRGYGYQIGTGRSDWRFSYNTKGFGASYKDQLRQPGPWGVALIGFGEVLPNKNNTITLDETSLDQYGIPQVKINFELSDNEKNMQVNMRKNAKKILQNAGAIHAVSEANVNQAVNGVIHEMGTARMGDNPKKSFLNKYNQSHDISNLYITDGSAMTSGSCVNPSLTYMALTARACDYAVNQLKKNS